MKNMESEIFKYLSEKLSPKRFKHSCSVSEFAVKLAVRFGIDILKVQTAALLHDCAKCMSDKELMVFLNKGRKKIKYFKVIVKHSPQLLHSYAGEKIIKERFNIKDAEILASVRNHTLGRPAMSIYEKILFVSDAVAFDRKYKGVYKIRRTAMQNIDDAFMLVLSNKITYVIASGQWLCPQTIDTWNYYAQKN